LASKRQVDFVRLARDDIEERRDHFLGLDEARGAAFAAHRPHLFRHARRVGAGAGVDDVDRQAGPLDLLRPHFGRHFERRLRGAEGEACGRFIVSSLVVTLTMRRQPSSTMRGATRRAIYRRRCSSFQ
jgi:hypothetical protein